jgi:hypothetical protein
MGNAAHADGANVDAIAGGILAEYRGRHNRREARGGGRTQTRLQDRSAGDLFHNRSPL